MPKKRNLDLCTAMELRFVDAYFGNATKAAEAAGSKRPSQTGGDMMARPRVLKAIAAKQAAITQESGRQLAKVITPDEVTKIMAGIARNSESDFAKVAAANLLAKILGMIVTKVEDINKLSKGRSPEEMDFFAIHGYWPDPNNVQPNEPSTSGPSSRDARVGQPN